MEADLLALMACPRCNKRPPLRQERDDLLVCTLCGYGYAIENEICKLLPEDAIPPEEQ